MPYRVPYRYLPVWYLVFGIWYLLFINLFHGAGVLPSGSVVDVIVGVCLEV
jgi:hypothetical protein